MNFQQGYFGATSSGHDLLACAPEERERFLRILDRTDVQGILPAGTAFETYVTAFRVDEDFVLMRTSVDEKATRAGMVFSHVLIAAVNELPNVPSIGGIIKHLKRVQPKVLDIAAIESKGQPDGAEGLGEPSAPLINALLAKGKKPAIWPDQDDFLEAIDVVWRNAWPELRALLTFTMGLSPEDAHLSEYAVLYVPASLTGRWPGFSIISTPKQSSALDRGASALAGGPASSELLAIAHQVSWPPANFAMLKDLEELRVRVAHARENPRDEIRTLRLLCFTAPLPTVAVDLKKLVLGRTLENLSKASLADILACRNLNLTCLPDQTQFWTELSKRIVVMFAAEYHSGRRSEYLDFLRRTDAESPSSWYDHVVDGIRRALAANLSTAAPEIFSWISESSALATLIISLVPQTEEAESSLVSAVPKGMSQESIGAILAALVFSPLTKLRATCLAAYLSVNDAFDWELSHEVTVSALPALASRYSPDIVISQAIRTEDVRLLPIVVASIKSDPTLLLKANLSSSVWRSIVKQMRGIRLNPAHSSDFVRLQTQMVDFLRSGESDAELLATLGTLGFFDLSSYSTDSNIWATIPVGLLQEFIQASICGAATRLARNEVALQELAEPLRKTLEDRVSAMSCIGKLDLPWQIKLFAIIPVFSQTDFRGWYSNLMMKEQRLSAEIAREIGSLIAKRNWRDAAGQVANDYLSYRRHDLAGALIFIKPLLGTVARFKLMFSGAGITTSDFGLDDLWEQLEIILVERFTQGPREHGLWDKSKGHDGDLLIGGSAREQWHHALRLIRDGRQHAPKLDRLLEEARNVHSDQHLTWFYQNWRQLVGDTKGH
jgi:hypothetical protein